MPKTTRIWGANHGFPQTMGFELNTNNDKRFWQIFLSTPRVRAVSWGFSGMYGRERTFRPPTSSREKPPPYQTVSGPKSLCLCFFVLAVSSCGHGGCLSKLTPVIPLEDIQPSGRPTSMPTPSTSVRVIV